jgi:tRNA threonylcarbamoyladenosine biosynthesis protein TsaB
MRILSIDTASTTGSVAVLEDSNLLSEITVTRRATHSRRLMDMVDSSLNLAGLDLKEIDGIAYTRGPGSFTGLRIGLSVIKGLALTAEKAMVGVSTLEALAHQAAEKSRLICPMMDARNNEVYCASYRPSEKGILAVAGEAALSPENVASGIAEECLLIGDGAWRYKTLLEDRLGSFAKFADPDRGIIRASTVARLGNAKFKTGITDDLPKMVPVYLRKSYAEQGRSLTHTNKIDKQ